MRRIALPLLAVTSLGIWPGCNPTAGTQNKGFDGHWVLTHSTGFLSLELDNARIVKVNDVDHTHVLDQIQGATKHDIYFNFDGYYFEGSLDEATGTYRGQLRKDGEVLDEAATFSKLNV